MNRLRRRAVPEAEHGLERLALRPGDASSRSSSGRQSRCTPENGNSISDSTPAADHAQPGPLSA